ncbi:putative bifunctional diguanylate cyclase/phosphodiesterase [Clostridiisalibacter paucivorans]|uniref:putative bifunctional diguanylate cyclase/phosphodiesterase n=1 Tax=Clostridiisalibacter paucivorans TaxID=408753 RepID=UPI000688D00A|nr:bifunctional diguanylate cyclase/phosphodiesterase [Clostridiisalibacter paucivorans]
MKFNKKFKNIKSKAIFIPLIIVLMLSIIASGIINGIKKSQYNNLKTESLIFAKNHSHSLSKVIEANEIINRLLEEKLQISSRTITFYDGEFSNNLLNEMAQNLKIDKIYYYSSEGKIIYSSDANYIGWKVYEGHPVYEFMNSKNENLVEDIRRDTESEFYYKYAYFRLPHNGFIQVGISADKIHDFLENFDVQDVLENLKENTKAVEICLIDNNFKIISSTNLEIIGQEIVDDKVREMILKNNEYSQIDSTGDENVYDIYVPVDYNNDRIGTLHFTKSLKEMEDFVKSINVVWKISIFVIFISMAYIIFYIYYENKQLIKLAYYDSLTDLPNKKYLIDHLTEDIGKDKDYNRAILLINCIDFKSVNLLSGYQYGDKVLKKMSIEIKKILDSNHMAFRFTADRFVVYVNNYQDKDELILLSKRIESALKGISIIESKYIDIQIGIVEINNNYEDVDQILKDVSIALNHINDNDNNYIFFNSEMEKIITRENYIEGELRKSLAQENTEKIYLEYQPQVELKTNRVIGFEALARMKTEKLGFISPLEFIDVAERKHLIAPLGDFILKKACSFLKRLNMDGYKEVKVAVNVSGIQLLRDDFNISVENTINKAGINGSNLELEITESILVKNFDLINEKLEKLRGMGITIALDDFGTGYSSFARLRELNIDLVKIDKLFIDGIICRKYNELITGDIISMSHKIGLAVVAEGVEVEEQKQYLIDYNCDFMQGYLFSRPLAEENALQILQDNMNKLSKKDG